MEQEVKARTNRPPFLCLIKGQRDFRNLLKKKRRILQVLS